ncbi:hypothetical protein FB451DRAFT_1523796 [Mycena latifolia]|nr:hypothetical protein FB451DRAFT_1523796 [Mycena latifolia]
MPLQPTVTEIRLNNIVKCLSAGTATLEVISENLQTPFLGPISNTMRSLLTAVQNVKRNRDDCTKMLEQIYLLLSTIIQLHVASDTGGALSPSILHNLGKFTETLHKIHTFVEAQQERSGIKQFFRQSEMNSLLKACQLGLDQALEAFKIQGANILNDITDMQQDSQKKHEQVLEFISGRSDGGSERFSIYKVKRNREDLKELCENIMEIMRIVRDQLSSHGDTAARKFKGLCEDLERVLQGVLEAVKQVQIQPQTLGGRFKQVMNLSSSANTISGYRTRIQELRLNFMNLSLKVVKLMTAIDTNLHVQALATGVSSDLSSTQVTQSTTICPSPSRIFHGRRVVLDHMHQFFKEDSGKQHIFLLYGLGGAGKTQIALKFIEESLSQRVNRDQTLDHLLTFLVSSFSDVFLIDASTSETIDTGLKNIAATRSGGTKASDALQWLKNKSDPWLLLFDNTDDPRINLNQFFPQCKHGNIIITSRNPGLRVYAGSHSQISDMEESDAVELLLTSAAQETTVVNKKIAADIVKALCYLPLAIIQAGAFISKSDALDSYLTLYMENRTRLLSEKPSQSHDDYAWTVYTTWQISFAQLSKAAAILLQLCSFLHHEGIYEEIFSYSSRYRFPKHGPTKEELQEPLEFLSQFLGPSGAWDSLRFMEVTNEIRAYSLVNFNPAKKTMVAIMGMSISRIPEADAQLASLKLLPHLEALLNQHPNVTPHFHEDYGLVYGWAGRFKEAKQHQIAALDHRRNLLGDDHPDTLGALGNLAVTAQRLGQTKEVEEIEVQVLEKRRKILGDDHPATLNAMMNLAVTYREQKDRLTEAAELEAVVLEKRRKILGEDHPDSLQAIQNLAVTYHRLGQVKEAEHLEVMVLEKRKKLQGEDHPDTLASMTNLVVSYGSRGGWKEAEELGVVVLEKSKRILGKAHPNTLLMMGNMAAIYNYQGRFTEAEPLYIELLATQKNLFGDNHPDVLRTTAELAATYSAMETSKGRSPINSSH